MNPACTLFLALLLALSGLAASSGARPAATVVLYSKKTPHLVSPLPYGCCTHVPLEGFRNPGTRAETVILAGHTVPPVYVGHTAPAVARAIASFHPSLVVLSTCYGASTPLLDALAAAGVRAWVVAAPFLIHAPGFVIEPGFWQATDPAERGRYVRTEPPFPLLRWRIDPERLKSIHARVEAMSRAELKRRLRRVLPALVRVELPSELEPNGRVLVPVLPRRLR